MRQSRSLAYFHIEHVPRELNAEADALANAALDRTGEVRSDTRDSSGNPSRESSSAASSRAAARTISARFKDGALHPVAPLDLPEGAEVEITIRPKSN